MSPFVLTPQSTPHTIYDYRCFFNVYVEAEGRSSIAMYEGNVFDNTFCNIVIAKEEKHHRDINFSSLGRGGRADMMYRIV
jgi:hypothetical protein